MGIVAVVLAISFSAFTVPNKAKMEKKVTDRYWYFFNYSTGYLNGEISAEVMSKLDAIEATECDHDDEYTIDCARGYDLPQNPVDQNPGPGDEQVKRQYP